MEQVIATVGLELQLLLRLFVAALLGGLIGWEREREDKPAGLRTNILVCLGAATFTVLSIYGFGEGPEGPIDASRVAAQIVSGIGFIGAGVIFVSRERGVVQGVTTAATIWAVAAIGMAAGAGMFLVAAGATVLVVVVLTVLTSVERIVRR